MKLLALAILLAACPPTPPNPSHCTTSYDSYDPTCVLAHPEATHDAGIDIADAGPEPILIADVTIPAIWTEPVYVPPTIYCLDAACLCSAKSSCVRPCFQQVGDLKTCIWLCEPLDGGCP